MSETITQVLDKMSHEELLQFAGWYANELKKDAKKAPASAAPEKATSTDDAFMRQTLGMK